MKKIFFPLLLVVATFFGASAQGLRLNLYANYTFDDGFDVYNSANDYYKGTIKGGMQVGGGLEYLAEPHYGVELLYLYKKSDAPSTFKVGNLTAAKSETFEVTHNWVMLSMNSHMRNPSKKVEGTAGLMLGMLISDVNSPSANRSESNTHFAWGFKLAGDIWISEKIAIKLQTHILSASKATGGDVYYGYWGPVGVTTYTTLWQYSLGGGLVYNFGK